MGRAVRETKEREKLRDSKQAKNQGRRRRRRRRKQKKSNWLLNIILLVAIIIFAVSGFQLFKIAKGYMDGRSEYEKIQNIAIEGGNDKKSDGDGFKVDFDRLLEINPDTVGWIRFSPEPAIINYPIVQGEDNDKYLHKTFSDNENTLGTIFVDVNNKSDFNDRHTIIYGHRMKDGSMFRKLQEYEDKKFWKKNPYFYIYTPDGREIKYQIFAAEQILDTSDTYDIDFANDAEFQEFLKKTTKSTIYDTGVDLKNAESIVTLSTCTSASDEHRFVVRGVKVEEKEVE